MPSFPYRQILEKAWADQNDPSHDIAHIKRVLRSAKNISQYEGGDWLVIEPAVWLHDLVNLPKNHADRHKASFFSAEQAVLHLRENGLTDDAILQKIHHAITAHSFSAGIVPETLEAKIVQDADRLDSLGCLGMMRTFAVSGALGRPLFHSEDPFAEHRELDDKTYGLDHLEVKLFRIAETLHTQTARDIAAERVRFMHAFVGQLKQELGTDRAENYAAA